MGARVKEVFMSTATAHAGALGKLKPTSVVGYGLGDFGCNLSFSLATSWLLFYYTDVAGFSAAAMGTMFFVVRLWTPSPTSWQAVPSTR
jgi:glucuronide carrier protein